MRIYADTSVIGGCFDEEFSAESLRFLEELFLLSARWRFPTLKTTSNPKTFDCVEFKRQAQSRIYDEIKDLSPDEQIAYYRRRAESGSLAAWWRKVKAKS